MTAPELKPCPFCGRAMEITDDLRHYNHPVSACFGRHISIAASDIDRIEMWNRRADLAAVQPDPNAGAVKVKPLVWEPVGNPNGRYRLHSTIAWARNTCPYGPYFIGLSSSCKNGEYSWDGPANTGKRGFADPESAKAAAQADYAARILDALEPQPDPRDEVIARLVDALTVAANRLDRCAVDYETGSYEFIETCEWVDEARAALAAAKAVVK